MEGGVPKTEDDRIILSSQSEGNSLVLPEGTCEGCTVDAQKLAEAIATPLNSISKVYDISFISEVYADEVINLITAIYLAEIIRGEGTDNLDIFTISFNRGVLFQNKA